MPDIYEDYWGVRSKRKGHFKGKIKWKKNGPSSYEGVSLNSKYDFNIRREKSDGGYNWVVDVFDHTIKKDHDKAYIDSFEADSLEEAKEEAEGWI